VFNILEDYELLSKVGYFIPDNTKTNDTALSHLGVLLKGIYIEFNAKASHLRFLGHVINFVVNVLLYGSGIDSDMDQLDPVTDYIQQEIRQWNKRDHIDVYGVISYISWSLQRRQEFTAITKENAPNDPAVLPIAAN